MSQIHRIYVEKRKGYDVEAEHMLSDLNSSFGLELTELRLFQRYDISDMTSEELNKAKGLVFSEPMVDDIFEEELPKEVLGRVFAIEYLPGQYDQRADSAAQCVQLLTEREMPIIHTARVIAINGELSDEKFEAVKKYLINPVESREALLSKPDRLEQESIYPPDVEILEGFRFMDDDTVEAFIADKGLAMSHDDLQFMQDYFISQEDRDPTLTELKVIDTYWSDHCRHTTFRTNLSEVAFGLGKYNEPILETWQDYLNLRLEIHSTKEKPITLMDIATIGMKEIARRGKLDDLDESEEINACSIKIDVDVDGVIEPWILMFKNETHNHPTEIEPFGGAATCLGGAIRDPLSGRSYVYQAMRVTGSADPRTKIEDTLPGKLPQRKITTQAAAGYSSYGNQIGLSTGKVSEIYHPGYVAKRMEVGAVVAAAKASNIVRMRPELGDVVVLVGGRTGRDGCGGATGSSIAHTEDSIVTSGAEVQKGNAPTERKLQRLFRRDEAARLIKRCNDFGAGGVSVAIGELAEGLNINLDVIPKKYEGLDGTELAISESQERMAVVLAEKDVEAFKAYASEENLEATVVAHITNNRRMTINWRGKSIVSLSRDFLDSNGAARSNVVKVNAPDERGFFVAYETCNSDVKNKWIKNLQDLNVCSQVGMGERFDGNIGAASVFMPFGGVTQLTPAECMIAKIPVLDRETTTGTVMAHGYNPYLSSWSPFHGAAYAIVEAVSKVAAACGDWRGIRLSLQEYFEKLYTDETRWGKPLAAVLGALWAQLNLDIPAIGGKDSVSGTFKDMDVPPTLIAFAIATTDVRKVVSSEFKGKDSQIWLLETPRLDNELPDMEKFKSNMDNMQKLIEKGVVKAARAIDFGGIAAAISEMCFGNMIGAKLEDIEIDIFAPIYGSIIVEVDKKHSEELSKMSAVLLGSTTDEDVIKAFDMELPLGEAIALWKNPLEEIFPTKSKVQTGEELPTISYSDRNTNRPSMKVAKPRVFIPVFPGTNSEYDTHKAFLKAGASPSMLVVKNLVPEDIGRSAKAMADVIRQSQIIAIPGGFSAGDEPDGSGKFIATMFRNPYVSDAVMDLIKNRDGLVIGICNGFQALIKLGLLPYGEIRDLTKDDPTLTFNTIGRHVSRLATTRIASTLSPWMAKQNVGDMHTIAISHGEGRFVASEKVLEDLKNAGQIATQYVDANGKSIDNHEFNPNGSTWAIEGITSPDGRVLGKMGHTERSSENTFKNVPGNKFQKIFESGVEYFS